MVERKHTAGGHKKGPAWYRGQLRRGLRRYREGKIGGDQLAHDVESYLQTWAR